MSRKPEDLEKVTIRLRRGDGDELVALCRQRGYAHGYAPYWLSYRLTFLFAENPIVAPLDSDRYYPYTQATERARRKAFIFDPDEHSDLADRNLAWVRRLGGRVEVVNVAGFTVILYDER